MPSAALLILSLVACVDRLYLDIDKDSLDTVTISGFISNAPGPYTIEISKSFDIESKESIREPITVKSLAILDNSGRQEFLTELTPGTYQTDSSGIRGEIGRAYKIKIELYDGRTYESIYDTLHPPANLESATYNFVNSKLPNGLTQYGFDIWAKGSAGSSSNHHFLWQFIGTFEALTNPTPSDKLGCFYYRGKCNYVDPCSGLVNVGGYTFPTARFVREKPCECCTCWYQIYNRAPILTDDRYLETATFGDLNIYTIPLNSWIFMYKIHVNVSMLALSNQSYRFWNAIVKQKEATGSLFQPITGNIPTNMVQLEGEPTPINGIFYSASISSKTFFINPSDVPNEAAELIDQARRPDWLQSCLTLFPNATNIKPSYWID